MKNNFGPNLKALRNRDGLDQSDLGEELKISRNAIGLYEKGTTQPKIEGLIYLAEKFNVTLDELILDRDDLIAREPEMKYGGKMSSLEETIKKKNVEIDRLQKKVIELQDKLNEILEVALENKKK
ncbi:MAG: helix-turn-helix transcriptional regulator [Bacteroidota bacterium]